MTCILLTPIRVFALGLPCADEEEPKHEGSGGLSIGAKAGIGAGAGVVTILAIILFAWLCLRHRKHRREEKKAGLSPNPNTPAIASTAYNETAHNPAGSIDPKYVSGVPSMTPSSPPLGPGHVQGVYPQSPQPYPGVVYQVPVQAMPGYGYQQPYSPPFGYIGPQGQMIMPQDVNQHFTPVYGPVMYPSYGTGSPPPFYNTNPGSEVKPVEADSGQPTQATSTNAGTISPETQSQGHSRQGDSTAEMGAGGTGHRTSSARYT
jgi:hypothetical protein